MRSSAALAALVTAAVLGAAREASAWQPLWECGEGRYARWLPTAIPVRYSVNPQGSGLSSAAATEQVQRCFDHWRGPCCSGARAEGAGETGRSALVSGDGASTIGFLDDSWPRDLGDPETTLAVTMPQIWPDCHVSEMDVVFNETSHDFCYEACAPGERPFEFVATHELGHFFGLGHSADPDALMYYRYQGSGDPAPRDDDVIGICTLYPDDHCECDGPEDCEGPLDCVDGACVAVDPCEGVDCPPGERCIAGDCAVSGCSICAPCTDNGPCGANGQCVLGATGGGRCVQFCGPAGSCPGDSECFRAAEEGEEVYLCLNPDADEDGVGICPDDYECRDCGVDGCEAGEQCFDGSCRPDPSFVVCLPTDETCTGCPDAAEGCLAVADDGGFVCTVRCVVDEDCGEHGACVDSEDPIIRVCVNADHEEVGSCPPGWAIIPPDDPPEDSGCGCRAARRVGEKGTLTLLALLLVARRRLADRRESSPKR